MLWPSSWLISSHRPLYRQAGRQAQAEGMGIAYAWLTPTTPIWRTMS
eukprot:COSAG01_NODE_52354_length_347_cov_0.766129_1_plen_46_part_10